MMRVIIQSTGNLVSFCGQQILASNVSILLWLKKKKRLSREAKKEKDKGEYITTYVNITMIETSIDNRDRFGKLLTKWDWELNARIIHPSESVTCAPTLPRSFTNIHLCPYDWTWTSCQYIYSIGEIWKTTFYCYCSWWRRGRIPHVACLRLTSKIFSFPFCKWDVLPNYSSKWD